MDGGLNEFMRAEDFSQDSPGRLVPTIDNAMAFVPDPIPTEIQWDQSLARALSEAENALGNLAGSTKRLVNPYLIGTPLLRREAIVSSRMEGTVTTARQLVLLEAGRDGTADGDTQEVLNYMQAMQHGLSRLRELPVCTRLLQEIHGVLMKDVRGGRERPGEFRTEQNWIGVQTDSIHDARFVPPPPNEIMQCMGLLETYMNEDWQLGLPTLIRIAMVHYQFETIHPFGDGNGRIGRLLVPMLLCSHQRMADPLFYMSDFFEQHRDSYQDLMLRVSQVGDWNSWIRFFLIGVLSSASDAIERADGLIRLRVKYRERFQEARSSALLQKLIDRLFMTPSITINAAAKHLGITPAAASYNIHKLVSAGIVYEITGGTWRQVFIAHEIMGFMDDATKPNRQSVSEAESEFLDAE